MHPTLPCPFSHHAGRKHKVVLQRLAAALAARAAASVLKRVHRRSERADLLRICARRHARSAQRRHPRALPSLRTRTGSVTACAHARPSLGVRQPLSQRSTPASSTRARCARRPCKDRARARRPPPPAAGLRQRMPASDAHSSAGRTRSPHARHLPRERRHAARALRCLVLRRARPAD